MSCLRIISLALVTKILAREISFPPVGAVQHALGGIGVDEVSTELDLSEVLYSGLTTYANLPYVHCLAKDEEDLEKYDIAIIGAPFDTVGIGSYSVSRICHK